MRRKKYTSTTISLPTSQMKWLKRTMDAGWTAFPTAIIENQQELGLSSADMLILFHLASRWWTAKGSTSPSNGSIGRAIRMDAREVQRRIAEMEEDGLIWREQRRDTPRGSMPNIYHLDGLIDAANALADQKRKAGRKGSKAHTERISGDR